MSDNRIDDVDLNATHLVVNITDSVAVVTLNRPDRLNALSHALLSDLRTAFGELQDRSDVRSIVLTGAGRAFSAGADLHGAPADIEEVVRDLYNPLIADMLAHRCPIVAAVNGIAAGAGVSLAVACDMRVASADAGFQLSFVKIGLVPDAGASWLLPRVIGSARAAEMALLAERVSAETGLQWGLVNRVAPDSRTCVSAALEVAQMLASRSGSVAVARRLLRESWSNSLESQLESEARAQGALQHSSDYVEARRAFTEKRQPTFGRTHTASAVPLGTPRQ